MIKIPPRLSLAIQVVLVAAAVVIMLMAAALVLGLMLTSELASTSLASTPGAGGSESLDVPQWVMQSIQSLGVAGGPVMFFFWFLANRERKEWQKDFVVRTESFITTANEMATAMQSVTTAVAGSQATLQEQQTLLADMAATLRSVSRRKD